MPPRLAKTARAARVREKDVETSFDTFDYPPIEELNIPPKSFDDYARCIFGMKGFGKTTLASQFPGHLTLMYEPRRRNLKIWMKAMKKYLAREILEGAPDTWQLLINTTPRLIDDPTVKGLNFDSIDICYETCKQHICAKHKINTIKEAGKNSSDVWLEVADEFACYFDTLIDTGKSINFLSHMKKRESEELDGGKFDQKEPSCSPACLKYLMQACDIVIYYGKYQGKRAAQVRDMTGMVWCAPGVEGRFMQPDGKEVSFIEMPNLSEATKGGLNGYQTLVKAFNNECWDMETPEDERTLEKTPKPTRRPLRR